MAWSVEYTQEFNGWWETLTDEQQAAVAAGVDLLAEKGPGLRYPRSSGVIGSRHSHMRELRIQASGATVRVFYAFDPLRSAILLIGGDKTGNDRFYEEYTPLADRLYDEHLAELRQEGVI